MKYLAQRWLDNLPQVIREGHISGEVDEYRLNKDATKRKIWQRVIYNLYPITPYNNHLGKPLYKFGRKKLKLGELGSLYIAKLPGTCAVFGFAYIITQNFWVSLATATINEIITPPIIYQIHRRNKKIRGSDLESRCQFNLPLKCI